MLFLLSTAKAQKDDLLTQAAVNEDEVKEKEERKAGGKARKLEEERKAQAGRLNAWKVRINNNITPTPIFVPCISCRGHMLDHRATIVHLNFVYFAVDMHMHMISEAIVGSQNYTCTGYHYICT